MSLYQSKLLLFVEDPGAINYFLPLIDILKKRNIPFELLAEGSAIEILQRSNLEYKEGKLFPIEKLIKNYSLLIVGTSENIYSTSFRLIDNAKKYNVRTIAIVDSGFNAAYRFKGSSNDPNRYAPDYLLIPDEWSKSLYLDLGYKDENLFIVGHPMFDDITINDPKSKVRERILPKESLKNIVIVFISELSTGLDPKVFVKNDNYTLKGRGISKLRTEIVAEELLDSIDQLERLGFNRPYTILRRHPKETKADLKNISQEFDYISKVEDPIELVYSADIVIGMSSILLNQAYIIGTESVALLPEVNSDVLLPSVRSGEIRIIDKAEDLKLYFIEYMSRREHQTLRQANEQNTTKKKNYLARTNTRILEALIAIDSKN